VIPRPLAAAPGLLVAGLMLIGLATKPARSDSDHDSALVWYDSLDLDHDGKLTAEDAEAVVRRRFLRIDANRDGYLTIEEFLAGLPPRHDDDAKRLTVRFRAMDADHDGRVSVDEMVVFTRRVIRNADADHDGILTREEFEAAISRH
jgi:Ca2+-binding EF-hand superfamily protein